METFINKISLKGLPKPIDDLLEAQVEKKNMEYVWLHQQGHQAGSLLTVACKDKALLEQDFDKNFIQDTLKNHQILISILDVADVKQHSEDGYLFFNRYAQAKDQIFGNDKNGIRYWFFEHDLKKIRNRYLAGESLLTKYAEELEQGDIPGATVLYLKNIQHDLEFLEYLRFGKSFTTLTLMERLQQMEYFIPVIKQFFVKDGDQYYLLRQIENEDMVEYMDKHLHLIKKIKKSMRRLVLQHLKAKEPKKILLLPSAKDPLLENKEIKKALGPLLKLPNVEELFFFHKITRIERDHHLTYYYMLAVLSKENQEETEKALQKIMIESPADIQFVIIYHTRFWIQENTYESQNFFKKIMYTKNKIYTNGFHPQIHWNKNYDYRCDDLFIYKGVAKDLYKKHLKACARNKKATTVPIVPQYLYQYFGQVIKNRMYRNFGYLPETDDLETLWNLFIYSYQSDIDYRLAISQFSFDVIGYLHENREQKLPALYLNQTEKKELFNLLKEIKNTD